MKNKNRFFISSFIIAILTLLINLIAFRFLPNKVPVHWGISGEVDRYGSKGEHLLMSVLPLVLVVVLNFLPTIDPKKESFKLHSKAYSIMILFVIILISGINLIALSNALGWAINFSLVFPLLFGLFFTGMGNYMSQIRPNYFVGIRTPWTLASEYVWKKTHRFGGIVFIIVGLIQVSSIFFGKFAMVLFLVTLFIGIIVVYLYSYFIFKKNNNQKR
ncbi:MAG: SdpI family protein [Bacillota bacterium]|nr:SdpI family protein [Bacillota bacterium]